MPFNPATIIALLSGLTTAGGLFAGGGRDNWEDILRRAEGLTSPKRIGMDANEILKLIFASPGFSLGQRNVASGANAVRQSLNANLAARGLSGSGIGTLAKSASAGLAGANMANLNAQAGAQSFDLARALAAMRLGVLGPSIGQTSQVGNQLLGAGLGGFGDLLKWFLEQQKKTKPPGTP